MSSQATAARKLRIKADSEYFDGMDYDRSRYSEDVAMAARIFLIAVRNAINTDPSEIDSSSGELEAQSNRTSQDNLQTPRVPSTNGAGGGTGRSNGAGDHRPAKNLPTSGTGTPGATSGVNLSGRGSKRPAGGQQGRNSAQKTKKIKRIHSANGPQSNSDTGHANVASEGAAGNVKGQSNGSLSSLTNGTGVNANATLPPRSEVACRVKEDGNTTWILAKVIRYVSEAKKYEVSDSGDEEGLKTHMVFKKHIRILSKKTSDFERGARCFAVYPDTTVFYPATVVGRRGRQVQCVFDDEEDDENVPKEVDGRHVLPYL